MALSSGQKLNSITPIDDVIEKRELKISGSKMDILGLFWVTYKGSERNEETKSSIDFKH